MDNVIKILIADDHPLVREALRNALDKEHDFKVIGEACNGEEAIKLTAELTPSVVIMDITMPLLDGLEATKQIKAVYPAICILALTVHDDEEFILNMLRAGADGYLTKNASGTEVISAIRALVTGDTILFPSLLRRVLAHSRQILNNKKLDFKMDEHLTVRESEILKLIARGATNKDIASELGLSVQTVKGHILTLFARMNARSRIEAVIIGLRNGFVTIDDIEK